MAKTANINIRIDPEIKARSEQLFAKFGITVTDAVNIFLHQSLMVGGLPFEMKQSSYNDETEAAMQEARDIASGKIPAKSFASARELFEELDREC
ncbi:MAG: type II toxin-antitoxin system RelB/DinJ family antitoxin [Syntrophomonas sp.]